MFRSIRWRLVLSYVFLILLTLGVVGAIILQLVEERVARQEVGYLTANAEAVAHQAAPHLQVIASQAVPHLEGTVIQTELRELAETSALLSDTRVRILNTDLQAVADSARAEGQTSVWIVLPATHVEVAEDFLPYVLQFSSGQRVVQASLLEDRVAALERLSPETGVIALHRQDGAWGGSFQLDVVEGEAELQELRTRVRLSPRSARTISVPIAGVNGPLGWVEIGRGPDLVGEAVATTRQAFLYAAAGALLLAVVVGLVVSRGLTAPLRKLATAASQMGGGDLSIRAPVRAKGEIGELSQQFNLMAERLETSFAELAAERDALRRFIADASHELRTPITALRNFNDLLQGAAADDPAAQAEFLAESQAQIDRLDWITRHLLDLSRLDAGLIALDLAEHDVADLLEAAASSFRAAAQEKDVALAVQLPQPPLRLRCDRARIDLALCNLLDNACKFTSAGGQVTIGANQGGASLRLWVRDSGPGIKAEDAPHIFERFYRGKSASTGGSGLGLAIVRSIVQAHGGQVSVESGPGKGSRFVIDLPPS